MLSIRTEWLYHENRGFDHEQLGIRPWFSSTAGGGSKLCSLNDNDPAGTVERFWTILRVYDVFRGMVNHMCLSPPNPMAYGISSWSRMCQTQSWTIPNRGLWNWVSYFYLRWFEIAPTGLATGIVWYWVYHINKTNTTEPYKTTMLGKQHLHFRWIFRDVSMVSQNFHIKTIVFLAIWRSPKIGVAPIILHLMFGFSMK